LERPAELSWSLGLEPEEAARKLSERVAAPGGWWTSVREPFRLEGTVSNAGFMIWARQPGTYRYGAIRFAKARGSFTRTPSGCPVTAHIKRRAALPGGLFAISVSGWLTTFVLAVLHLTGSARLPWAPYAAGAFALATAYTMYRARAAAEADDLHRKMLELFDRFGR
jgi:hypothetical protein